MLFRSYFLDHYFLQYYRRGPSLQYTTRYYGKSSSQTLIFSSIEHFYDPEMVEPLFIAYRLRGDQIYRDHGWERYQAFEKHGLVESGGYVTIIDVDDSPEEDTSLVRLSI